MGNVAVISVSLIFREMYGTNSWSRGINKYRAWDQDLAQVPELPKDWMRWIDKVAVRGKFHLLSL